MTPLAPHEIDKIAQAIADRCVPIRAQKGFERSIVNISEYWALGEELATAPEWKKSARGNPDVLQRVAELLGMGERSIYYCLQFYEKYPLPAFEDVISKLPGGKTPAWREITKSLGSFATLQDRPEKVECNNKCPKHCQ